MSFPRYKKYKPGGVEWLGDVPEHWEVKRIGSIFRQANEEGEADLAILSVSIHDGVSDKELDEKEMDRKVTRSDDRSKYKKVQPGDLVYNMMRAWQGGFGAVMVPGMVSPAYVVARPTFGFSTQFVEQLLRTPQAVEQMRRYSQGVTDFRLRLYWDEFKSIGIVLPPTAEQTQIAAFLDRETAKIDELVAEQRRLMELLKEKRQAVISHAVTQGLNPKAPMKPSGIEWLGDVPEHWEALSLRRCSSRVHTGGTPSPEALGTDLEDGVVWYTPGDFGDSLRLTTSARKISASVVETGEAKVFPPKSVLVVSIGATLGKVGFAEEQSSANQQINAVVPNHRTDGYFLAYSLSVKVEAMRFLSNASTIGIMNQEKTKDIWVAVPPLDEQMEITTFLDTELTKLDTLTAEAQHAIDLLQERRTALISAAVTGQIDVRGLSKKQSA